MTLQSSIRQLLLLSAWQTWNHFRISTIIRYCFEHAPETCTVLSLGKCEPQKNSANIRENLQPSSRWLNGNTRSGSTSSTIENHISSKRHNCSPRTVFHQLEAESHSTEDDTFSLGDLSTTESPPLATNINGHSNTKKQISTSSSDNIVGRRGYSEVYRGDLSDGRTIAVKMLAKDNRDAYKEKEILMEMGIIGHVCHPNTANLLGCYVENGLYLIFNFSQNGNLASALRGKKLLNFLLNNSRMLLKRELKNAGKTGESLQWPVRWKIALGVSRGLHYLHKCCKHRIIHRDIKASNVLLGPNYEPQVSFACKL
ncbi:hypothetical protein DKX38_010024 [Salix brachista]|uniref:Protein kinase domain-containing protein n=1 Tax=Salix brachista TaxID=2182728 RepID=A0A5N5MEI1_9ROSI|nr:hypothetical protein DKX38_010024 [Salix brachista]